MTSVNFQSHANSGRVVSRFAGFCRVGGLVVLVLSAVIGALASMHIDVMGIITDRIDSRYLSGLGLCGGGAMWIIRALIGSFVKL